jgi:hypothetical protein
VVPVNEGARELAASLNAGIRDNFRVATKLVVSGDWPSSIATVEALKAAGVSPRFANQYVYDQARLFKPTEKHPEIGSLKYLLRGLLEAWATSAENPRAPRARPVGVGG